MVASRKVHKARRQGEKMEGRGGKYIKLVFLCPEGGGEENERETGKKKKEKTQEREKDRLKEKEAD